MAKVAEGREQEAVGQMFDRISRRYDLANRFLSIGIDQLWRRKTLKSLGDWSGKIHLDVASGTGDLVLMSGRLKHPPAHRIALDYSRNMMLYGQTRYPGEPIEWVQASADALPLQDRSVDIVTIAFGIRNVAKYPEALREFHRVLRPDGKVAVLEFSMPQNPIWHAIYSWYFRNILPRIGGMLSGNFDAYRYLPASVSRFPYGESFANLLTEAGFGKVTFEPLTGGIATLYLAEK